MADEDVTLDGKALQSLRVADLKAALEQRKLPKSGQKNTLIKRLKGALMLENLQKSSSSHSGLQPNSQIGEEMCQNSFIKQYLAKQQELLRQRLEREAQQEEEADESPAVPDEDEEQSEDNDSSSYIPDKHSSGRSQPSLSRPDDGAGDVALDLGLHQESSAASGARTQRAGFLQGLKEAAAPSPPRAVASLSVRVLGQPDRQGLPPTAPRAQEKEGAAPGEPGSAHPVLHLSRSVGSRAQEDGDEADDDESDDDEDWAPGSGGVRRGNRAPPPPQQTPLCVPSAAARSKRKLQPPQHIPPPQVHHTPMQLRHPTPPPSPPPNLFPLPDTPKQSPPDDPEGEGPNRAAAFPPVQRRDSDSSSRSSSPDPPAQRRPGPLSLLVHKMELEKASQAGELSSAPGMAGEAASSSGLKTKTLEEEKKEREKKHLEEEKEKQRKGLEEEQKRRRREEEERKVKEEEKKKLAQSKSEKVVVKLSQDSGSSSDSDSSRSSHSSSSSSSGGQSQLKKPERRDKTEDQKKKPDSPRRELSEPSTAAVTEVEPESESSMAQQAEPESSEGRLEESPAPKAFAARKISLTSSTKTSPAPADGAAADMDAGAAASRKRRWGSSTAVTAKKPSISITTDSLKSLIPDMKVTQDAVVELHPEELPSSGDEENPDDGPDDPDKGLKIRRTVTQVVPGDGQENGQTNEGRAEEEEEEEEEEQEEQRRTSRDQKKKKVCQEAVEAQTTSVKLEGDAQKISPSDGLVRRSINQQKCGVSVTIDDPVRAARQPSPPRGKLSSIIHVTNLVRPFTLGQLKELLNRTGAVLEDGFWIDKIKSHCFVTYATIEEAVATRSALHGVKWPTSNPKVLNVDFSEQDQLDFHKGVLKPTAKEEEEEATPPALPGAPPTRPPPLMPERDRERERSVRDLWAEREREMERRERARGEREWDRDKVREFARPGEDGRRSRSRDRERRRRERAKSKERKSDKKAEKPDEPPAKLLDDLFLKTKAAPCIYWLPLTDEQAAQRLLDRSERQKERERRRKEQEEEDKKREEEKRERLKGRDKDGGLPAGGGGDAERGRGGGGREREADRKRDGSQRSRRASAGPGGGGRRSRSRSNPRDRRR
ncbi:unnamed protein product [Ophioblennius macclurei]